jgi:hypothetical protein
MLCALGMKDRGRMIALWGALTLTIGRMATAEPTAEGRKRAGASFDGGVAAFKRADYADAAKAFLLADELAPNSQALTNAIAAGRRAHDDLLVARASERALSRGDPALGAAAREALSEASARLAVIEASCEPKPCALALDGVKVPDGRQYVLPGTHDLAAHTESGGAASEHVNAVAGATYRLALRPASGAAPPAETPAPRGTLATATIPPDLPPPRGGKSVPPAVFYAGVGVTGVLAAVMTWSGLDTLHEAHIDPTAPEYNPDAVLSKIHRTDMLIAATAVVAGATAFAGILLVDWGSPKRTASSSTVLRLGAAPTSVGISASGRF